MSHNHQYAAKHDTKEKRQQYDRARKRNLREIDGVGTLGKPFIGVDGEGGNDGVGVCKEFPKGHHQYYLLGAGKYALATGKPLTTDECLNFICNLSPDDGIYVAFFFDYDVTMILRGMRPERIERLFNRESRTFTVFNKNGVPHEVTNGVDYGEYQIDYIPHKEFKVRRRLAHADQPEMGMHVRYGKWVVINDVGQFFQCSFVKALTLWDIGTPEERAAIADGKGKRADFTHLEQDTITYNALEMVLTAQLMEAYRQVCLAIDYSPARWQGPGWLAAAMLKRHGLPKKEDLKFPTEVNDAAVAAYYGGRFETTAVGELPGPVYAYDINSAYPDALTRLPCLIHGTWEDISDLQDTRGRLYLAHGTYTATEPANLYNFPCRNKDGSIKWPMNGSGWFWSVEIETAVHQTFKADTVYALNVHCDCVPFDWVPRIYAERIKLGKTTKGMVLKLAMNSLYGKTCQSVGAAPYANSVWASLITAMTRAKLMSISHSDEIECRCYRVYMLATDAIFTRDELDIPSDKVLGGWDRKTHESLFLIMPGLYFTSRGGKEPKTRGVPREKIVDHEPQLRAAYRSMVQSIKTRTATVMGAASNTHVLVPLVQFVGLKIANHRNRLDLAGEWMAVGAVSDEPGRKVRFYWGSKREINSISIEELDPTNSPGVETILTRPYPGGKESEPYDKDIGRRKKDRAYNRDQPDWADVYMGDEL